MTPQFGPYRRELPILKTCVEPTWQRHATGRALVHVLQSHLPSALAVPSDHSSAASCRHWGDEAGRQPKPVSYPDQSTAALQQLAMRYGTHPACLGWGLLNEPVRPLRAPPFNAI